MNSSKEQEPPQPQNVVSLLGAATETLYRLGLGHTLIARSHECDYPPSVLSLPCISRPRLDVQNLTSAQIDATVRQNSATGEPIYRLDEEALDALERPIDLLIAQDHCRVCAVTPREIEGSESCRNIKQLVLRPATLEDCLGDVELVADAMGCSERGVRLRATLEERLERVRALVADVGSGVGSTGTTAARPRVALLEWCDPIMGCGYWIPELIQIAGGTALHCPPPGGATPTISAQTLLDSKPDVVIFALCGFGLVRAANEIASSSWGNNFGGAVGGGHGHTDTTEGDKTTLIERLTDLCGGTDRIFIVDGNYLVNRSGPRLVESCEAMVEAIHPELLGHFGHFGSHLLTTLDRAMAMVRDTPGGPAVGLPAADKVRVPPFEEDLLRLGRGGAGEDTGDERTNGASMANTIAVGGDPADAVTQQLRLLKLGDLMHAFAINSKANRDRWCSPDRFEAVMRSHADFCRLLSVEEEGGTASDSIAGVGEVKVNGLVATVRVSLPEEKSGVDEEGKEGSVVAREVNLIWTMVAEIPEDGNELVWRTEKVGMAS